VDISGKSQEIAFTVMMHVGCVEGGETDSGFLLTTHVQVPNLGGLMWNKV